MRELFIEKRFNAEAVTLIDTINDVLDDYSSQGYDLSLRQVYYQLVSKNVVPNTEQSYKRIGNIVSDARLAGLMDWEMIVDRGREAVSNSHWDSPADVIQSAAQSFRIDLWENQPTYVEVMVEKQALEGVLIPVCEKLDVTFTANKGYSSSSAMYEAGKRIANTVHSRTRNTPAKKTMSPRVVVFYLGDHDPSGIDMTRDVEERLSLFAGRAVDVRRVALNMDQVRLYKPPPNPAKMTDSRAAEYVKAYGTSSWELDAIEPRRLARLVEDAVKSVRDDALWNAATARQKTMRDDLKKMATEYANKNGGDA